MQKFSLSIPRWRYTSPASYPLLMPSPWFNRVTRFISAVPAPHPSAGKGTGNLANPPPDVTLLHFFNLGAIPHQDSKANTRYHHKCFFVGTDENPAVISMQAEYIPVSLSQVPGLIENGRIPVDVALVQVSPPDEFGYASLGVSVDITASMTQHAKHVIAEINPNMPRTLGDSLIHISRFDAMVWNDSPTLENIHEPSNETIEQIARNIASIIEDRSTLQIGLGRLPQESLKYLTDRRDLGIHSDLITDGIVPLLEKVWSMV